MKKKFLICLTGICLLLASCSTNIDDNISNEENSLKMLTTPDGVMQANYASNDNGCYIVVGNNIKYIDYESSTEIFLCSNLNCEHKDSQCNGFIDGESRGELLFTYNNVLFLLKLGNENRNFTISKMNLDGSERVDVLTLPPNENITSGIAVSNNKLYFIHPKVSIENDNTNNTCFYSEFDLDTNKLTDLCELKDNLYYLIGGYDKMPMFKELNKQDSRKEKVVVLDIAKETFTVLKEWKTGELAGDSSGGNFYYIKNNSLYRVDSKNSKEKEIGKSSVSEKYSDIRRLGVYDNKLVMQVFYKKMINSMSTGYVAADIDTGEFFYPRNGFSMVDTNDIMPISILAQGDDEFLVVVGFEDVETTFFAPDGSSYTTKMPQTVQGIIKKSDYWSSNPSYTIIKSE